MNELMSTLSVAISGDFWEGVWTYVQIIYPVWALATLVMFVFSWTFDVVTGRRSSFTLGGSVVASASAAVTLIVVAWALDIAILRYDIILFLSLGVFLSELVQRRKVRRMNLSYQRGKS